MVNDPLSGVAGGVAGTTAMTLVLFIADAFTGFQIRPFQAIAAMVGTPDDVLVGFLLFFGAGAIAWPLLFVSFSEFLPGERGAVKGMVFATVLWTSFALAFSPALTLPGLVLYLAFTWVAHLVYGGILGEVYGRIADHDTDFVTPAEGV